MIKQKISQLFRILGTIGSHELASRHRIRCYVRFLTWQICSRLSPDGLMVPFTTKTRFFAKRGMTGATGNIYLGLHEFQDMSFLLHFLREEDVFLDVGANVGSYTILAAGHVGAKTWSFEPVPNTFTYLRKNIEINKLNDKVVAVPCAVGAKVGTVVLTSALDTVNHVVSETESKHQQTLEIAVVSLNEFMKHLPTPSLVKIDVEGFENEVLAGMSNLLSRPELKALIIELNGSGLRYGHSDSQIHHHLLGCGFDPFGYAPFQRDLVKLDKPGLHNTIYVKDIGFVNNRLRSAQAIKILNETI